MHAIGIQVPLFINALAVHAVIIELYLQVNIVLGGKFTDAIQTRRGTLIVIVEPAKFIPAIGPFQAAPPRRHPHPRVVDAIGGHALEPVAIPCRAS